MQESNKCASCPNHENTIERLDLHEERLNDHADRLRATEIQITKMEVNQLNIDKSLAELKLEFRETRQEHSKQLNGFLTSIRRSMEDMLKANTTAFSEGKSTNNKIKLKDRKEIWALIALVVGWVLTQLAQHGDKILKLFGN